MNINKRICLFVLIMFFISMISPAIFVQPASAVLYDPTIAEIVADLAEVYPYIDDGDKPDILLAQSNLSTLAENHLDPDWTNIIDPLLTPQVTAAFSGDETAARNALIDFTAGIGDLYYSSDSTTLNAELTSFKNTYTDTFQILFGTGITMEELYQFYAGVEANLPDAISSSYINDLAFGTDSQLVTAMPNVFKEAIRLTLADPYYAEFSGKLGALGWDENALIDQKIILAGYIDPGNTGELALAKAAVRSKTELAPGMPSTISAGRVIPHTLMIMNRDATNLVEWQSSNSSIVQVTPGSGGNDVLTARAAGTATITAYRDVDESTPADSDDWLYRYTFTVTSSSSGGGGGGGGGSDSGETIDGDDGGNISDDDYGLEIDFPEGVMEDDFTVTIVVVGKSGLNVPSNVKIIGRVISITKDISGNFDEPVTITLEYDPDEVDFNKYTLSLCYYDSSKKAWYELDNVKVDKIKHTVSGEVNHFTNFGILATEIPTTTTTPPVTPPATTSLTDVSGHWAAESITKLVNSGAIAGYPDNTFRPDASITRAEFASILVKAFNLAPKDGKVFNDTANHWAKANIATAQAYGIINGYNDTTFGPDDKITREQMAIMIVKAANLAPAASAKTFKDSAKISTWAKEAVATAVASGIIAGYPDDTFKPQGSATRAEAVTVIVKALK